MKFSKTLAAAAAIVALSGAAQAALIDRGGGLIYDTTHDITWLADMNYANGTMNWAVAKLWADNLVYGGYSDWRLPTLNTSDTTCSAGSDNGRFGYNCTGGELSHLFVTDLGNKANHSVLTQTDDTQTQKDNFALFSNVQSYYYWSGTELAADPDNVAWYFLTADGSQNIYNKSVELYAVAVRPGNVTAAVPEPQTLALALLALGATVVARRRRPA